MFYKAVITSKGLALDAKIKAGQTTAAFTRVKLGDGTYDGQEELKGATDLKNTRNEFGISSIKVIDENTVRIRIVTNNSNLNSGYYISELALFATDPDEGEILYSISLGIQEKMDYQPSEAEMFNATATIDILTSISDVKSAVIVSGTGAAASAEDLMELMYPQLPAQSEIDPDTELDGSQELEYLLARFECVKQNYVRKDKVADENELGLVKVDGVTIGKSESGTLEVTAKATNISAVDTQGININTATGTTQVTVSDAWEAPIPGLEIAGKSDQGADPSPDNPQEIVSTDVTAVTVKNKNLTGPLENGSVDASGNEADDKSALRSGWISINPGKTYTFSRKKTFAEESKRCMGRIYDIDKNFLGSVTIFNNTELKKVISNSFYYSGARYIRLVQFKGNDETYDGLDLQMEEGDTVTDYEPPMLRTAAITLTEPLRGIGDVRDRIMYRNGMWGIERNISMDILTEDTVRPSAGGMNSTYPNCIIDNRYTVIYSKQYSELSKKGLYSDGKKTTGYCNIAPAGMVKDWSVVSGGLDNVYSINGLGGIYIAVPITVIGVTETATMDEVNAAIKQYVADNDVYVMFVLDAPTWDPLPAATQSALNALTTYTGQTTITVTADGPEPDITMQYYGQPGAKTNVQSMLDSQTRKTLDNVASIDKLKKRVEDVETPDFDASGTAEDITDKTSLLASFVTKMPLVKFMRNIVAGFKLVLYSGQIVNNCVTDRPDLPGSAAQLKVLMDLYTVLNTKITNNGIVDSYSGDAVINLDWVRAGTVVYKVLNGTCFVDFDITVKAITAVNTLIVSGLPTSTIVRHGRIAGWENGNISMPFYLNNTDIIANPCSAGRYAGCFSFSII